MWANRLEIIKIHNWNTTFLCYIRKIKEQTGKYRFLFPYFKKKGITCWQELSLARWEIKFSFASFMKDAVLKLRLFEQFFLLSHPLLWTIKCITWNGHIIKQTLFIRSSEKYRAAVFWCKIDVLLYQVSVAAYFRSLFVSIYAYVLKNCFCLPLYYMA